MDMKQRLRNRTCAAAVALGGAMLGSAITRGDGREDLAPQRVHLQLGVLATGAGRATYPGGARTGELAVGETQEWSLIPSRAEGPGCATSVSMPAVPDGLVPDGAAHVWATRLTVRAATLERIEVDVDWRRYVRTGSAEDPQVVAGDRRSLELREGQRHLLDFVEMPSKPGWESCYSLALELKAGVAEDPALVDRRITYDLWLVDEGPGGSSTTHRTLMTAKHGESREFDFQELRRPLPSSAPSEGGPSSADTHVEGHLRGRITTDGFLELALVASRSDSPGHRPWGVSGSGEKRVKVAAGETIRLELPSPKETPARPGVSAADLEADRQVLTTLRDHKVSLVLTARPVD
jgi:hypothetical protein